MGSWRLENGGWRVGAGSPAPGPTNTNRQKKQHHPAKTFTLHIVFQRQLALPKEESRRDSTRRGGGRRWRHGGQGGRKTEVYLAKSRVEGPGQGVEAVEEDRAECGGSRGGQGRV